MKEQFVGLDIIRGLGIFILIWMHSAFYYFDGLYDLDLTNPPLIVTIIGLLLMFAGIFALVSGTVHTYQLYRKSENQEYSGVRLLQYNTVSGILILAVAYIYFVFTGPGLVNMNAQSMNNSIFVDLIRNGEYNGFNLERMLYVDSLVMIGLNILLLGLVFIWIQKLFGPETSHKKAGNVFLFSGLMFFLLSLLRIPLFQIYYSALEQGEYGKVLVLNWLVNKNNPIMPYFSFALLGGWIATMLVIGNWKHTVRKVLPLSIFLLVSGVYFYIKLPDTMLERSIDFKWFAIMAAQLGLFMLILLFVLAVYDFRKAGAEGKLSFGSKYIYRFGIAGLTAFFFESIASAIIYRLIQTLSPGMTFNIEQALLYGFCLAVMWGFLLMLWEKKGYKYGIEYFYVKILSHYGKSAKEEKLKKRTI
ncbi:MAG: hypothetical protein EOM59_02940 [Clostridia bacterium]|nr:hypothetical protein [Clostridia bacterium]